jgi:hypothetical protein
MSISNTSYAVAPAMPLCLRQQGTSPIFYRRFLPGREKIVGKKKKKYHGS